jgi:hypothetical protein
MTVSLCVMLLLLGAPASSALETWWIPAAASNPGLHGTVWTTDLWLYSRVNDEAQTVTASFFSEQLGTDDPIQTTIELPPITPVEIKDAVATLFGENRPGSIRLEAEYPFFAKTRTSNSGGSTGIYGQGIPAFSREDTALGYSVLGASNRPGPDGVRTNIGIASTSTLTETVHIFARDPVTHDLFGTTSVEIGPFGWFQADLFDLVGLAEQTIELAEVSVFPSASYMVYISLVDNRSGDGTFIYGSSGQSISIAGNPDREFEVQTTLTYDDGVTVDWIKWPGPDGDFVYTQNPESGYVTGIVVKHGPSEYCVDVVGTSGPTVSGVTVSIKLRPPGGNWSGGSSSYSTAGNSPIDQEFCKSIY